MEGRGEGSKQALESGGKKLKINKRGDVYLAHKSNFNLCIFGKLVFHDIYSLKFQTRGVGMRYWYRSCIYIYMSSWCNFFI